jgi:hypothetical protein
MADVLVIFPPDRRSAAEQLAQASRDSGYEAALAEIGTSGTGIAELARGVPAALLVWSRPLVSSAVAGTWLAGLRQLPNLIEVSTDGIEPETGEAGRVVLLSGWRGQPHHLGWQRIVEALKRIHAPRPARGQAERPLPTESRVPSGRQEAAAGSAGRGRRFALPALAAMAALVAVAALTWNRSAAPAPEPSRRPHAAAPVAAVPLPGAAPTPAPAGPTPEARGLGEPFSLTQSAPPRDEARPTRPSGSRAAGAAVPVKRYSRRYSKTMRLFCARSGRSTPQCRIYLRSVQASRG